MMRRLEIRPVVSRRLRAALLLVLMLAGLSLSQSSLTGWLLTGVLVALGGVFMQAWLAASHRPPALSFSFRPLVAHVLDANGAERPLRCTRLSVYPWLMVLHAELAANKRQIIVLLPDSLADASGDEWRQLLVWAKLMRRQIALN